MARAGLLLTAILVATALILACGDGGSDTPQQAANKVGGDFTMPDKSAADQGKPSAVVAEFYAAMKEGDLDRIFATYTPEMLKGMENQLTFLGENPREQMAEGLKAKGRALTYEILGEDFTGMVYQGRVPCDVKVREEVNGEENQVTFRMQKIDGTWLIGGTESSKE